MSEKRVLIVEDEAKIAAVLRDSLVSDGCSVDIRIDGSDVVEFVRTTPLDLGADDYI